MSAVDRLDEIQKRADNATDGPWRADRWEDFTGREVTYSIAGDTDVASIVHEPEDAVFIAHARTDVPALVAALRAALSACESYERAQGLYRIEVGQREIIRSVRAEITAALGEGES